MKTRLALALALALGTASPLFAADKAAAPKAAAAAKTAPMAADNPFAKPSTLPFQYPAFDKIKNSDYAPAFEAGMAEQVKEVDAIADNKDAATFDNTLVALERSGQLLTRVSTVFFNLSGTNTNDEMEKIQAEMAPKLSAHQDAIALNPKLFARVDALFQKRDQLGLDAESKRLVERYHTDFVRAGAKLNDADKAKLKAFNAELASLQTSFSQNLLKENNASALVVDTKEELKGLSDGAIATAAEAAKKRGLEGKYVITLQNTSGQPALAQLENRAVRERLQKASVGRASHGGEFDNRAIIAKVAKIRAERAALLGYPDHATYVLEDETAHTVKAVNDRLSQLAPAAVANAKKEAADMQALIDKEKGGFQLAAWDWSYYAEKVRTQKFNFDESQLRPYFEFDNVLVNGVFYAANKLYGISFKERKDLPVYQPDVRTFDVFDKDGKQLAIFIVDWYARDNKRGGAWMNEYVSQSGLFGTTPVVANHLNIPKPPKGEPTLLTFDEANTAFHEFGHALHGMFSNVKYPRFSGTSVPRDFVEYPSQVNEMWMTWPEIMKNYAKHYKTGEPIPQELVDKVLSAQKFNQGFATTEYLGAALLDQAYHQIKADQAPTADTVLAFEANALKKAGVDYAPVPPRYRSTYFSHILGGYSAGYYAYIWSEVLDADSVEWFKENGGLTRKNGDHFRDTLLSRGGSVDAMQLFRDFRGRDPDVKPLLERRGLTATAPAAK
ncbi:M3 family metallopeptidase [Tahibacter soli]|uniref:Dipeptidyl carboxypeptidase n=1 Tax=Tahibacter soli TaxID=2983605 RepID=A0A9X3YH44_9GAMM|nr:M3 family metallopeptidase [Tahibacter soli]MDC8012249.1 M3 family metallopeptidase [Tahibacter soli]